MRYLVIWCGSGAGGDPYVTWHEYEATTWQEAEHKADKEWPQSDPDFFAAFPIKDLPSGKALDEYVNEHYRDLVQRKNNGSINQDTNFNDDLSYAHGGRFKKLWKSIF